MTTIRSVAGAAFADGLAPVRGTLLATLLVLGS